MYKSVAVPALAISNRKNACEHYESIIPNDPNFLLASIEKQNRQQILTISFKTQRKESRLIKLYKNMRRKYINKLVIMVEPPATKQLFAIL